MSSWKFEIYLDGSWIDLTNYGGRSLVPRDGIEFDGQQHNEGKSVVNTMRFDLVNVPIELMAALYQQPTYELVPIEVTRDEGVYFTGFMRPVDSYTGEAGPGALERSAKMEAVDVLWRLQKTLSSRYVRNEETVDTIVRELLLLGGFISPDIVFPIELTQTVANISERADDKEIIEILDELLFDYHHCLIAGQDGTVDLFDWKDDGVSAPVGTIQETIGDETQEKTDEDYGHVTVGYKEYGSIESWDNILAAMPQVKPPEFQEFEGGESKSARIDLDATSRLSDEQDFTVVGIDTPRLEVYLYVNGQSARSFRGPHRYIPVDGETYSLIYWARGESSYPYYKADVTATFDGETHIDVDMYLYPDQYYSVAAPEPLPYDIDIVAIDVYGTIHYEWRAGDVREETEAAGERTARRESYEADYIFDRDDAQSLAEAILQLRQYGSRHWIRRSSSYIPLGSVVTVQSAALGLESRGRILRLVDSQSNATPDGLQEYVYTIETLDTATSINTSDAAAAKAFPAFPQSPRQRADRPTYEEIVSDAVDTGGPVETLPTPTVMLSPGVRAITIVVSYERNIVGAGLQIQLQVSRDGSTWYELGPGGEDPDDWKGELDGVTVIRGTSHTHAPLPLEGDEDEKPLVTTYYYRAGLATPTVSSEWSDVVSIGLRPIANSDIIRGAIGRMEMNAGFIEDFDQLQSATFPDGPEAPSSISINETTLIDAQSYLDALESAIVDSEGAHEIVDRKVNIITEEFTVLATQMQEVQTNFASLELNVDGITTTVGQVTETADGNVSLISQVTQRVDSIESTLSVIDVGDGTAIDLSSMQQSIDEIESQVFTGELDASGDPIWRAGTVIEQLSDQIASLVFNVETLDDVTGDPIASQIDQQAGQITSTVGILNGVDGESGLVDDVDALEIDVERHGTQITQTIDGITIGAYQNEVLTDEIYLVNQAAIDVTNSRISLAVEQITEQGDELRTSITLTEEQILSVAQQVTDQGDEFNSQISQLADQISARVQARQWDESTGEYEVVNEASLYLGVDQLPAEISRSRYIQMEGASGVSTSLLSACYTPAAGSTLSGGYYSSYVLDVTATTEQQDALYGQLRPHSLLVSQVAISADEILLEGSVKADLIDVDDLIVNSTLVIGADIGSLAALDEVEAGNLGATIIADGKIRTDLLDVGDIIVNGSIVVGDDIANLASTGYVDTAQSNAESHADSAASTAQSKAESYAATQVTASKDSVAQSLGYSNFADIATEAAANGSTLIVGGMLSTDYIEAAAIKANMIDVDNLFAQKITASGSITSNGSGYSQVAIKNGRIYLIDEVGSSSTFIVPVFGGVLLNSDSDGGGADRIMYAKGFNVKSDSEFISNRIKFESPHAGTKGDLYVKNNGAGKPELWFGAYGFTDKKIIGL